MVLAKFIMPNSYGQLSLFTTMVSLLSIFICLNTSGYIGVNFFSSRLNKIQRLLNVVLLTTLLVYLVLLTLIMAFPSFWGQVFGLAITYQFYAISFCALQVVSSSLLEIWRLEEKVWCYGIFTMVFVLSNFILTILFVGFFKWDWQGRMYAQVVTCACFSLLAIYILKKKDYLKLVFPQKRDFKAAYSFGIPLIPHSTSFWLRQGLDRYMINAFSTQSMVGFFSFASNFANIIQIVGQAFNASNSVNIYKLLAGIGPNKIKLLHKDCRIFVFFYATFSVVVFLGSSLFIPFLFPKYKDCIIYIFPLCIGAMFQCFYLVYVNILFFYKKTRQLMYITFSFSILHALLSFIFTRYGVIYTAYISVVINFFIAVFVYVYSQKILKKEFEAGL